MRGLSVSITVVFMLIAQLWASVTPRTVLCVPIGPCGEHALVSADTDCHAAHDDCCGDGSAVTIEPAHEHGLVDVAQHSHPQCRCHVHIPVERREWASGQRTVERTSDQQSGEASAPPIGCLLNGRPALLGAPSRSIDAGSGMRAQVCALKCTRLLV